MAKQNATPVGQPATPASAKPVRRALAPAQVVPAPKAAPVAPDSGDDFGILSAAEKAFLDGLAKHRDAFSADAVEARSNSKLKSS